MTVVEQSWMALVSDKRHMPIRAILRLVGGTPVAARTALVKEIGRRDRADDALAESPQLDVVALDDLRILVDRLRRSRRDASPASLTREDRPAIARCAAQPCERVSAPPPVARFG